MDFYVVTQEINGFKNKTLVMGMCEDKTTNATTNVNLELLCDIGTFLHLACILPLIECVQRLYKFAHSRDILICNIGYGVKIYQGNMYEMFCDLVTK
jgi:hypothetical protein